MRRLDAGVLTVVESSVDQRPMGLPTGELVPAVGDFNRDARADIMNAPEDVASPIYPPGLGLLS